MATRERPADRGRRRCRAAVRHVASDGLQARVASGLSQRAVADAIHSTHSRIGRFERDEVTNVDLAFLSAYCAVVGLDLSIRTYPAGDPIRDRAQLALLERFRARLHPSLRWRTEIPLPVDGDLRAWDAEIRPPPPATWRVRVEAETRIADGQALERKLGLKLRDDPGGHLVLLVSDTRANRASMRALRAGMRESLPLDTRELLAALKVADEPGANGIVFM